MYAFCCVPVSHWSDDTSYGVSKTLIRPGLSVKGSETDANRCPPSANATDLFVCFFNSKKQIQSKIYNNLRKKKRKKSSR